MVKSCYRCLLANYLNTTNINNKRARHVYESLGAKLHQIEKDAYKDSRGQLQTAYDYRLNKDDFQCFN